MYRYTLIMSRCVCPVHNEEVNAHWYTMRMRRYEGHGECLVPPYTRAGRVFLYIVMLRKG